MTLKSWRQNLDVVYRHVGDISILCQNAIQVTSNWLLVLSVCEHVTNICHQYQWQHFTHMLHRDERDISAFFHKLLHSWMYLALFSNNDRVPFHIRRLYQRNELRLIYEACVNGDGEQGMFEKHLSWVIPKIWSSMWSIHMYGPYHMDWIKRWTMWFDLYLSKNYKNSADNLIRISDKEDLDVTDLTNP